MENRMNNEPTESTGPAYELRPIGIVESPLLDPAAAPLQGDEGSPEAWLVFDREIGTGLRDLQRETDIIVLTWLHRARRDVLSVHPRGDPNNPEQGVFNTRSPDRPNPIGLHRVAILAKGHGSRSATSRRSTEPRSSTSNRFWDHLTAKGFAPEAAGGMRSQPHCPGAKAAVQSFRRLGRGPIACWM
jgi:tRNA-Thr(GGU) m(6)t(6)A37 methyltransferase TsaA